MNLEKIKFWFNAARGYSIPMSIMSWSVPFLFGLLDGGNLIYGLIALFGTTFAHAGVNLFDDYIDYSIAERAIKKGKIKDFEFINGKCEYILSGKSNKKELFVVLSVCFALATICGIFLTIKTGLITLLIMLIAGIIGALYPLLSYIALGETAVALMFSPLMYIGVYFVMTSSFSPELLPIAISTGLLTVGLLHAHMFLDYDFDVNNKKNTLCSIAGCKENAVKNQAIIMFLAYFNIILFSIYKIGLLYLITLLSLPTAMILYKLLKLHISDSSSKIHTNIFFGILENMQQYEKIGNVNFMIKFMVARNLMVEFTILVCVAKILSEIFKCTF